MIIDSILRTTYIFKGMIVPADHDDDHDFADEREGGEEDGLISVEKF